MGAFSCFLFKIGGGERDVAEIPQLVGRSSSSLVPKHLRVLVSSLGGTGIECFDFSPHCLEWRATRKRPSGSDCGVAPAREPAAAGFCVALSLRQAGPLEGWRRHLVSRGAGDTGVSRSSSLLLAWSWQVQKQISSQSLLALLYCGGTTGLSGESCPQDKSSVSQAGP